MDRTTECVFRTSYSISKPKTARNGRFLAICLNLVLKSSRHILRVMANKKIETKAASSGAYGQPKFPYAYTPTSLDRLLSVIVDKPRPDKINPDLLKAWGFKNSNDRRNITVLKLLDLLDSSGVPNQNYLDYKDPVKGPEALGRQIKKIYDQVFKTVSDIKDQEQLRSFFNSYGGGGESVVKLQILTFKSLVSHATFGASDPFSGDIEGSGGQTRQEKIGGGSPSGVPAVRIDLHIHLPQGQSKTDYESILEGIAKHIYGRSI